MEYILLGALLLGMALFVLGWLMVAVAGFQRHPVTGLLALLPVLNVVALPSLWHRVSGWVITGLVGALLAGVAWFAGANAHAAHYAQALGLPVEATPAAPDIAPAAVAAPPPAEVVTHTVELPAARPSVPAAAPSPQPATVPLSLPAVAQPVVLAKPAVATPAPVEPVLPAPPQPLPPTEDLPAKALYHMVFKELAVDKLPGNEGRYVRVIQKDGRRREGKVLSATADTIELEERMTNGSVTLPISLGDIRSASIMTSEGNP